MAAFLGFLFFLTVALCGFWLLTFLALFVPYWLIFGSLENLGYINKEEGLPRNSEIF